MVTTDDDIAALERRTVPQQVIGLTAVMAGSNRPSTENLDAVGLAPGPFEISTAHRRHPALQHVIRQLGG
jgi:hypothetical protein